MRLLLFVFSFFPTFLASPERFALYNDVSGLSEESGTNSVYRLPITQIPSGYVISLLFPESIFSGTLIAFGGTVSITFSVTNDTDNILLHAPSLVTPSAVYISQPGGPANSISVSNTSYNSTTNILTISLGQNLIAYNTYVISINYTARVDITNMAGVYRSMYVDENNETQYLITTQFEPTHARKAFPCFDEPRYKATFQLSITHPGNTKAFFNAANEMEIADG